MGYRENGLDWQHPRDARGTLQRMLLLPEDLVRGEPITVTGAEAMRRFVGVEPCHPGCRRRREASPPACGKGSVGVQDAARDLRMIGDEGVRTALGDPQHVLGLVDRPHVDLQAVLVAAFHRLVTGRRQ